jgi:hypothetical protein
MYFCQQKAICNALNIDDSFSNIEAIIFDLIHNNNIKLRCILMYRPPNSDIATIVEICNCIKFYSIISLPLLVLGDFNFNLINWRDYILLKHDQAQNLFF